MDRSIDGRSPAPGRLGLEEVVLRGREALMAAQQGIAPDLPGTFTLNFWEPDTATAHYQLFEDSRFCDWRIGVQTANPLAFVATPEDTARMLSGSEAGQGTFEGLRVRTRGEEGPPSPPPPLDLATSEALRTAPCLPGVSSTVALRFDDTPFGCLDVTIDITEGRPSIILGEVSTPDVSARLRFGTVLKYLAGDVGFMDMLHGGNVEGEWTQLMLVAGVIESPDFQLAVEPMRDAYRYLADAVELLGADWYNRAMKAAFEPAGL